MKIRVLSIPVRDQEKALQFYTEVLGFEKKHDIPLGGENRWLTVVSSEEPEGPEVLLEPSPNHFEPSKTFQEALYESGIPCCQFNVSSIQEEYDRLIDKGVIFSMEPTDMGGPVIAVFDDTCGNHIQLVQE